MPPKPQPLENRDVAGRFRRQEESTGPGDGSGGLGGRQPDGSSCEDLRWPSGGSHIHAPFWRATGLRSIAIQIPSQASPDDNDALASSRTSTASTWTPRTTGSGTGDAGRGTPLRSPEAPTPREEEGQGQHKKKQRLGWGDGLAKYEKKKAGGAEDEATPSIIRSLPRSASPTSTLSVAPSSCPGMVDKNSMKLLNDPTDGNQLQQPSCSGVMDLSQESILSSLMLDVCSGASASLRHTAMSKLLVMKDDISKELEETENDIDILEGQLRSLYQDLEASPHKVSFPIPAGAVSEPHVVAVDDASKVSLPGKPLITSSGVNLAEEARTSVTASVEKLSVVESMDTGYLNADTTEVLEGVVSKRERLYSHRGESYGISHIMMNIVECTGTSGHTVNLSPDRRERVTVSVIPTEGLYRMSSSSLIDSIIASNRDIAKNASQVFDKLVPTCSVEYDLRELVSFLSHKDNRAVKEKVFKQQRFLKFKQKVLAIRYRLAYSMCINDVQLLSKTPPTNPRKWFSLKKRLKVKGISKVHSDSPSSLPSVGKQTVISTREGMNFATKLVLESKINIYRPYLKMPACVPLEERRYMGFISNNALIEDPIAYEKEKYMINPWSREEKQLFLEMLATYGKDFSKIASFLKHKTTADCVEFYYKNHKSEIFDDVKKKRLVLKQSAHLPVNSYLVTLGRKWKPATNAFPLKMLQPPEACLLRGDDASRVRQICSKKSYSSAHTEHMSCHGNGPSAREATSANALAGYGALPCDAMSSCITSSITPAEKADCRRIKCSSITHISHSIEEEEIYSDDACGEVDYVDWTDEEKSMFVNALSLYGKDFARISECVGSRAKEQCKVFFSKARKCLGLDAIHARQGNSGTLWGHTNAERSYTEDVCAAEMDSGICSTQSCSKADADFMQLLLNPGSEGFTHTENACIQLDTEISSEHDDVCGSVVDKDEIKDDEEALKFIRESVSDDSQNHPTPNNAVVELGCSHSLSNQDDTNQHCKESMKNITIDSGDSTLTDNNATKIQLEYLVSQDVAVGCSSPICEMVLADLEQCDQPEGKSANKLQEEFHMNTSTVEDSGLQSTPDGISRGHGSLPVEEVNDLNCPKSLYNFQTSISCKLLPGLTSNFVALDKKEALSFPILLTKPSSICFDEHPESFLEPTPDYEKHGIKKMMTPLTSESSLDYLSHYVSRPLQILKGHPLSTLKQRDMSKDMNLACNVLADKNLRKNGVAQSTKLSRMHLSDSKFENYVVSRFPQSICKAICSSKSGGMSDAQLRPCSQCVCLENEAQSSLKLFGKILSHQCSSKKLKLSCNGDSSRLPLSKQDKCPIMMPSSLQKEATDPSTQPHGSYEGLLVADGLTSRSYCFWDGSQLRKGLHEAAFPSSQHKGQKGGRGLLYSAEDGLPCNGGVLARYQEAYLQEVQNRNGINVLSAAMQQPSSRTGSLGMRMPGRWRCNDGSGWCR